MSNGEKECDRAVHNAMNIGEPESFFGLEEFELYKTAREFRQKIYKVINSLPREEQHALALQMTNLSHPSPTTSQKVMDGGTIKRQFPDRIGVELPGDQQKRS